MHIKIERVGGQACVARIDRPKHFAQRTLHHPGDHAQLDAVPEGHFGDLRRRNVTVASRLHLFLSLAG